MVQIMAWRRPGYKPLSEPMVVNLPTHKCVARPQWVNTMWPVEFYIQCCGALNQTHWGSHFDKLICPCLGSQFSQKATTVASNLNIPKLISQSWGTIEPYYFITLSLDLYLTYFWKHDIYYKKTPKLATKILATKFGFVPDYLLLLLLCVCVCVCEIWQASLQCCCWGACMGQHWLS